MIAAIADLFVERVSPTPPPPPLARATRLLAVDASGQIERLRELLAQIELRSPVSTSAIRLEDLGDGLVGFDVIWLICGPAADANYCALLRGELEVRFPAAVVAQLIVGADIDAGVFRGGPGWRRRAAIANAATSLAERLAA